LRRQETDVKVNGDGPDRKFRRVVIGHNQDGRSFVESDELIAPQVTFGPNHQLCDLWSTNLVSAGSNRSTALLSDRFRLPDRAGDVIAKMVVWPPYPEFDRFVAANPAAIRSVAADLSLVGTDSSIPNVVMHEVPSIDIAWIISGEITCVTEDGEATLRAGDLLMQRATNHGWINHGHQPCVMACASISSKSLVAGDGPR